MSIVKIAMCSAAAGMLIFSTGSFAQVGGGTELPSSAEKQQTKDPAEKAQDKGSMQKEDSMKKDGSMKKGDDKM